MTKVFNFSAGPSMLPTTVLHQVKEELCNWNNLRVSVMEISHRSKEFLNLKQETKQNLRELLNIPDNYKILFCHGGARGQFSAVPMNLVTLSAHVDYVNTGFWSYHAAIEAKKYCKPKIINVSDNKNIKYNVKSMSQWDISSNSIYLHYCPNETIDGIAVYEDPCFYDDKIIVADCSSMLLSCPLNISSFGIIYAAAQKNIGISGLTVVIIREDLLGRSSKNVPSILNYQILSDHYSMFNTPATISWYIANLVFKWLKEKGGLQKINQFNKKKAALLYNFIDSSDFYYNNVDILNRSYMNIPFFLKNKKLEDIFLKESLCFGLYGLRGHRAVGGIRASLYNAMTLEGVQGLVKFMKFFSKKYG